MTTLSRKYWRKGAVSWCRFINENINGMILNSFHFGRMSKRKQLRSWRMRASFSTIWGHLFCRPSEKPHRSVVTPRVQVVDGQQRLTTFQLFLAAIREVARTHGCKNVEEHVGDYLFNKLKSKDTDKLTQFKLTPTPSDQSVFFDIVKEKYSTIRSRYQKYYWGDRVPMNTPIRALRAYEEFYRLIDRFARFGSVELNSDGDEGRETETISDETDTTQAIETRLEAMLTALLNRMKLVVIVLGEDDDAQIIFETLNSKGGAFARHGSRAKQHFLSRGARASGGRRTLPRALGSIR